MVSYTDRIQGTASSTAIKVPCRTVATSNITLSGLQTVSGVALADKDRVLVTGQTNAVNNGIWVVQTGAWYRALDFNGDRDIVQGTQVFVTGGSGKGTYYLATAAPLIDDTNLAFTVYSDAAVVSVVADLVANPLLSVGQRVRTQGYYEVGDGGDAVYDIVTVATHGGTPDGYGDHLLDNGLVAAIDHPDLTVVDAQYGVKRDTECSARWQAAFWAAADLASESIYDGMTATFRGITDCKIKNKLYATARDGGTVELLNIDAPAYLKAQNGGNLAPSTYSVPIPLMTVRASSCKARWGVIDCNNICSGWLGLSVSEQIAENLTVVRMDCYGVYIPMGASGDFKLINPNIKQWRSGDPEREVDAEYTAYGLVVGNKDIQFLGGEIGWCKLPLLLLDASPELVGDRVEGRNYFRGYESEGTGGCTFTNIHPMAGRPGGPPRVDQITQGGPTLIEVWNNTNICQINFADLDSGIVRIYGKGVEFNRPNAIVGGKNSFLVDRAVVLDPLIRVYANGSLNPSRLSINSEQGTTIGFYDFEGDSWDGDYSAWNRTGRQSTGLWLGDVDVQGFWDPTTGSFPASSTAGDYWVVQKDGTVGGEAFVAGDGLISLVNNASTTTLAANWEHNTISDVEQRDESAGTRLEQGARVVLSRNNSNDWLNIYAPGDTGKVNMKMRVGAGNVGSFAVDEAGTVFIDGDMAQIKNWQFVPGGDLESPTDDANSIGSNLKRLLNVFTNVLNLKNYTPASNPPAGRVLMTGRAVAGRTIPAFLSQDGVVRGLQTELARSSPLIWKAQPGSTAVSAVAGVGPTATGTATAVSITASSVISYTPRVEYLETVAATNAIAGFRGTADRVTVGGPSANLGGFVYVCQWGTATGGATATHRAFVGLTALTTAPTDVQPSTLVNMVGMGWDAADANIQIMHNSGAGSATKVDLGSSFPVPSADRANQYELALFSPKGTTQTIAWMVTDMVSGISVSGTISTDMPTTTNLLSPRGWMSAGGTSSVIGIGLSSMVLDPLL